MNQMKFLEKFIFSKMNNLCPSQDYDFYKINFPLSALKKSSRARFLNSELEKLHPCFSDDCCFDSFLRIGKKQITACVVVMQKLTLAEYKAANSSKPVFIKECHNHPFFVSNKSVKTAVLLVLGMLLFVFACVVRLLPHNSDFSNDVIVTTETQAPAVKQKTELFSKDFFVCLQNNSAQINYFSWTTDGFKETSSIKVRGVFPEQLENIFEGASFSPVIFEGQIPAMTVELSTKNNGRLAQDLESRQESSLFKSSFRNFIFQNKIVVLQETVNPYVINIVVREKVICESLLNFLIERVQQQECTVSSMQIEAAQDKDSTSLKLEIGFSDKFFYDSSVLLENLQENMNLFWSQENEDITKSKPHQVQIVQVSSKQTKKLGQIIHPNGSVTNYFKDENGKIIWE